MNGEWSAHHKHSSDLDPDYQRADELSAQQGCLLWVSRVIVPPMIRDTVRIHTEWMAKQAMDEGTVRHRSTGRTHYGVGDEKHTKDVVDEPENETGDAGWTTLVRVLAGIILTFVFLPALGLLVVSLTVPAPINPVVISLPLPPKMEGALVVNDLLTTGERLFEDEIMGPESIVFHKGHMYTGTADGKIVDIKDGKMSILTTLGTPPCGSRENEPTCGRPLGLRMHNGSLFVIDTYLGLYRISVDTGN
ncbi:Adipocyte plasma membrane-associated protein [Lamellibrachia satsuma]|nr:Adipocyte plasma membrane-associated protein [Lamellibrachia satsuma]